METVDRAHFAALACPSSVTWSNDIKGMFTATDIAHMQQAKGFNLGDYNQVKIWATQIYLAVKSGNMPPAGSGEPQWTADMVTTFGCWIQQGMPE